MLLGQHGAKNDADQRAAENAREGYATDR